MDIQAYVETLGAKAREAAFYLGSASSQQKNAALLAIADAIVASTDLILKANAIDLANGEINGLSSALLDRLALDDKRILQMAEGVRQVSNLADPVGEIDGLRVLNSGIRLGKMRVPIGVIGIIYESRPNVTADAAAICLKSGNACVLRGGKEAIESNKAIATAIRQGLEKANVPLECIQVLEYTNREAVTAMITSPQYFDVIIPRGGKGLITSIADNARVAVIKHLDGNCHTFVDKDADIEMAVAVSLNAKTRRYGVCNAMETLLIDADIAAEFLPQYAEAIKPFNVELRGCADTKAILPSISEASESDWFEEFLAPILAVKVVKGLDEAIQHINYYGSHHTDAILTENISSADIFLRAVDSSSVIVNASTAFADGFEYGLGAEIGISTDKLHVRGPVGVEGLTTQKYIVLGHGETRSA